MRLFKLLTLAGGVAIFAWILTRADLTAVMQVMSRLGTFGAAVVLTTFGIAMFSDVVAWARHRPVDDRRHWHRACWNAKDRRTTRVQRSRNAPRY